MSWSFLSCRNPRFDKLIRMSKSAVVSRSTRVLAAIALACAGLDLVVLAGFHLIQPEIDPLTSATSEYVHGKAGAMSSVTSAAVGLGAVSLAVAVWRITVTVSARVGAGLLAVFGLAKLAQSFFPIDAGGATTTGLMHNLLGNLAFLVLPVAAILITPAAARACGRGQPGWWPRLAAWLIVLTSVLVLVGDGVGLFGLAQRIYLVSAALWTALVASWLWSARSRDQAAQNQVGDAGQNSGGQQAPQGPSGSGL